jgi:hypothetical protein
MTPRRREEGTQDMNKDQDMPERLYEKFRDGIIATPEVIMLTMAFPRQRTDEHGLNAEVDVSRDPKRLKDAGFTRVDIGRYWSYTRTVKVYGRSNRNNANGRRPIPPLKVTLWIRVHDDPRSRPNIDVLDEEFCQPYPYQEMLSSGTDNEYAIATYGWVEDNIQALADAGVVTGHVRGEWL